MPNMSGEQKPVRRAQNDVRITENYVRRTNKDVIMSQVPKSIS